MNDRCPLCFGPLAERDEIVYCEDNSDHYQRQSDGTEYVMGLEQAER